MKKAMKVAKAKVKKLNLIFPPMKKAMKVMKAMKVSTVAASSETGGKKDTSGTGGKKDNSGTGGKKDASDTGGKKDKMKTLCAFLSGNEQDDHAERAKENKAIPTKKSGMKKPAAASKLTKFEEEEVDGKRDRNKFNHFQKYYDSLPSEVRELYESATSGI
jgi:hypothetical protein